MSHYYAERPEGRLRLYRFTVMLRGFELTFYSASGIFSARGIDRGTRLLIESMVVEDGWRILDLGTGYGPIGIVAAKLAPRGRVVMTDVNRRALWLARLNAEVNGVIDRVEIRHGDLYEPVRGERFNTIITNPPQAAGLDICFRIIDEAPDHLVKGGMLQLVARHRKGGARLAKRIEEVFGECIILGSGGGYRVYAGVKR